jgi:nucleoside-diphosphate-sugar epimerase
MNNTESELHVVLGAGQIGTRLAEVLLARGHRVRIVRKSASLSASPRVGLEWAIGDVTDPAFAARAGHGATAVYDCMNPGYTEWSARLLPLGLGAIGIARVAAARLVALDCLYMYGRPAKAIDETTPMNPCSRKGELRVKLALARLSAHAKGDVRVAIGRASDFFGTDLPYSMFSDRFYQRVLAGKKGECTGDPNMPHSYTYAPDVAKALATLGDTGNAATAMGGVWLLPTVPAGSTQALGQRLGQAMGVRVEFAAVPKIALKALGLFVPVIREVAEMAYQWEVPYTIDDSRFRGAFGTGPTPIDTQVRDTAAWARARYSTARAA